MDTMTWEPRQFIDLEAASRSAAELITEAAQDAVHRRGRFTLVLAGGSTPRRLYEMLADPKHSSSMPWAETFLFWGDERCVPLDHEHSNYAMAQETLLSKVNIPEENVFLVPTHTGTPAEIAARYEEKLRLFFADTSDSVEQGMPPELSALPRFDLILLGMGKDGHTASLFPGDPALHEERRWVTAVEHPRGNPQVPRVTLTLPVINNARRVLFLVAGNEKRHVIDAILSDPDDAAVLFPAARVEPKEGVLLFHDYDI
jgi:6-phosphogluconolactonase